MGRTRVRGLEVAGLRLAIEVPPELPWRWPAGPLERFASRPENAALRVGVRVGTPEPPSAGSIRYDSGGGIFDVAREGDALVIALRIRGQLARVARVDARFETAEVVVAPESFYARETHYPLAYPLDELLVMHRLARDGGLLVHACAAAREGKALLFTGPSGAGKTTISRLLMRHAGARILSDDRIVLRPDEGGGFRAWGTPWHGDAPLSEAASVPLAAVHAIHHAREVVVEPLFGATAATAILGNAFLPAHDPLGAAGALELAEALSKQVPIVRLGFPKDARVARYAFPAAVRTPLTAPAVGARRGASSPA